MLIRFMVTTLALACMSTYSSAHADNDYSCKVEVAVSTPPVQLTQNVAFNVTSLEDSGSSKSITLKGGSAPQLIDDLFCNSDYNISATMYSTPSNYAIKMPPIGECTLKAGPVFLNGLDNSVSVVFPNDFICNQNT